MCGKFSRKKIEKLRIKNRLAEKAPQKLKTIRQNKISAKCPCRLKSAISRLNYRNPLFMTFRRKRFPAKCLFRFSHVKSLPMLPKYIFPNKPSRKLHLQILKHKSSFKQWQKCLIYNKSLLCELLSPNRFSLSPFYFLETPFRFNETPLW